MNYMSVGEHMVHNVEYVITTSQYEKLMTRVARMRRFMILHGLKYGSMILRGPGKGKRVENKRVHDLHALGLVLGLIDSTD
ncbi:hypothetical protein SLEP1_g54731 [Rubroshorea leprosula]|uniref:Uncharacterized protein n=1 Tax=Rubroshorea leprosula TaxID=152421 RepID=A0AAV5MDC2_9ROSI|nr:hypothetical protein SLEP1_g54731 [Rubroshorea leprosula]